MKPYFVYVLRSTTKNCFYIGVTEDVDKRLTDHNTGISKWTKNKGPWKLVWQRQCSSLSKARLLEKRLKRQKGGKGFYEITNLDRKSYTSIRS